MPAWDSQFAMRSPMFAPLHSVAMALDCADWPAPADLNRLALQRGVHCGGRPLRFEWLAAGAAPAAADYELRIHDTGVVPLRAANWHDLFNALVWLAFPRAKAALNRAHVEQLRVQAAGSVRGTRRAALTLLDESGVLVLSSDAAAHRLIRAFQWKRLFWEGRETLPRSTHFLLFGHGLYEKALAPYVGMSGHALLLAVPGAAGEAGVHALLTRADALAARAIEAQLASARDLSPLPVLGVPGWWGDGQDAAFYDNTAYFRPGRARTPSQARPPRCARILR